MYLDSNWIDAQKTIPEKREAPGMRVQAQLPTAKSKDLLNGAPSSHSSIRLPNTVQSINKIFASNTWAQMSINELK